MLECKEITKKYLGKTAVSGLSLDVLPGRIYALLGPNGSGKTTLMKMIAGLIKPNEGTILFQGNPIGIQSKKKVAYMSTEPFYYNYMTVKDVGKYYQDFFADFSVNRYHELLSRMELQLQLKAKNLSSGMAAKLKIAATLARKADLYMLDEPLNGIDIIAREYILATVLEVMRPEASLLISSHLVDELEKIVHVAIFMKNGSLVLGGDVDQLRAQYGKSIVEIYKDVYGYAVSPIQLILPVPPKQ